MSDSRSQYSNTSRNYVKHKTVSSKLMWLSSNIFSMWLYRWLISKKQQLRHTEQGENKRCAHIIMHNCLISRKQAVSFQVSNQFKCCYLHIWHLWLLRQLHHSVVNTQICHTSMRHFVCLCIFHAVNLGNVDTAQCGKIKAHHSIWLISSRDLGQVNVECQTEMKDKCGLLTWECLIIWYMFSLWLHLLSGSQRRVMGSGCHSSIRLMLP